MEQSNECGSNLHDIAEGFKTAKSAKNLFFWVILLSIAAQLVVVSVTYFTRTLDPIHNRLTGASTLCPTLPPCQAATTAPTSSPTTAAVACNDKSKCAEQCSTIFYWTLRISRTAAFVCAMLLAVTMLLNINLSMIGRTGGMASFIRAFFCCLVLVLMLAPWYKIFTTSTYAHGMLFDYSELISQTKLIKESWGVNDPMPKEQLLYVARFIGYPFIALITLVAVQLRFADGYQTVKQAISPQAVITAQ